MTYVEAAKAAKNSRDNVICLNDKNKGWIVWNSLKEPPFRYPYRQPSDYIKNPKVVAILRKRTDWQIADISAKVSKAAVEVGKDLSQFVMKPVAADDSVW